MPPMIEADHSVTLLEVSSLSLLPRNACLVILRKNKLKTTSAMRKLGWLFQMSDGSLMCTRGKILCQASPVVDGCATGSAGMVCGPGCTRVFGGVALRVSPADINTIDPRLREID